MTESKRAFVAAVALFAAVPFTLLAGGADEGTGAASGGTTATTAPSQYNEAPMLAAMVARGELPPVEERLPIRPAILEPVNEIGQYGGTWHRIYRGAADVGCNVAKINNFNPFRYRLFPDQIEHMFLEDSSISSDGKTWTLMLREGMKWSDGVPVTTADVDFAINDFFGAAFTAGNVPTPNYLRGASSNAARLEIVDDFTFRLHYDDPFFYFPQLATQECAGGEHIVMPRHALEQFHASYNTNADKAAQDAGFPGWVEYLRDRALLRQNSDRPSLNPWNYLSRPGDTVYRLERNAYYYTVDTAGNQLPYIDEIAMELVSDPEVIVLKALQGDLTVQSRHISFKDFPVLKDNEARGDYKVLLWPTNNTGDYFAINQTFAGSDEERAVLQDIRFRRAIAMAIDRSRFNELFMLGMGDPERYLCPASDNPFYPGPECETLSYEYDVAGANALLDQVLPEKDRNGNRLLPSGEPFTFYYIHAPGRGGRPEYLEILDEDLKKIGLQTKFEALERTVGANTLISNRHMGVVGSNTYLEGQLLFPYWIAPATTAAHTPMWAPGWNHWQLYGGSDAEVSSGGETLQVRGEKPPQEVIDKLIDPFLKAPGLPEDEGNRIMHELYRWHMDQLVMIPVGVSGAGGTLGGMVVYKSNVGNIPERAWTGNLTSGLWVSMPDQFFLRQ